MYRTGWLMLGAVLLVAASAPAQDAPPASAPASAPESASTSGYRIGPKDLVEVKVLEIQEMNGERRVSENGKISLPFLGDVQAAGLTDVELAARLKADLEHKLLQHASVSVQVREFRSRPISVIGAVQRPGDLELAGSWTLLTAIIAAGGLTPNHGNTAYVLRHADNGLSDQVEVSLDDLLVRADARVNLPIYPNDLINIPATVEVTIYFLGAVSQPGALTFKNTERMTLLTAVARAGGLTDRASHRIVIRRDDAAGKTQEIIADYKRITDGKEPDVPLKPGDVVLVKESFF